MGKRKHEDKFMEDSKIDVFSEERSVGNFPLTHFDDGTFQEGDVAEETIDMFKASMFDPKSGFEIDKEHCMIVSPDGKVLTANRGDEHSCGFTADETDKYIEGNYVVHNHPPDAAQIRATGEYVGRKGDAGTFSGADIAAMGQGEIGHVVCAPEGQYVMEFDENSDIEGFKSEIASMKEEVNARMEDIRMQAAHDWWYVRTDEGKRRRNSSIRREALRDCTNAQKLYWHGVVSEVASKHGISYRLMYDSHTSPELYISKKNDFTGGMERHRIKRQNTMANGGIYYENIVEHPRTGRRYGFMTLKDGQKIGVPLEGGAVVTGVEADKLRTSGKEVSWLSQKRGRSLGVE